MADQDAIARRAEVSGRKAARRTAALGVRLQPEDIRLLRLLCRYTTTTAPTLCYTIYADRHPSGIHARLLRLNKAGLIEDRSGPGQVSNLVRWASMHALIVPTKEGYAVAGTGLEHKTPAPGTLLHTLAVAEVGLGLEAEGYDVTTDREIRSEVAHWRIGTEKTAPHDAMWIPTASSGDGRDVRTHAPDLVYVGEDLELHAVEIEMSLKSTVHLMKIIRAFGRTAKYKTVTYYSDDRKVAAKVGRTIMALGLTDSVRPEFEIKRYTPKHSTDPRAASRSAA